MIYILIDYNHRSKSGIKYMIINNIFTFLCYIKILIPFTFNYLVRFIQYKIFNNATLVHTKLFISSRSTFHKDNSTFVKLRLFLGNSYVQKS